MTYVVVPDAAVRGGFVQCLAVLVVFVEVFPRVVARLEHELVVRDLGDLDGGAGTREDGGAGQGGAGDGGAGHGRQVFWGREAVAVGQELAAMGSAQGEASSVGIGEVNVT